MTYFLPDMFRLKANLGSTCILTSIFGHFWPMRVPVRLTFAKVCVEFSPVVCSWLVTQGIFRCRNDLSCFSFSFQHSIRPASERKESTESNQFSFKENKRRQSVLSCDKCVLQQSQRGDATEETCVLLIWQGQCSSLIHGFDRNVSGSLETVLDNVDSKMVASICVIRNTGRVLAYDFIFLPDRFLLQANLYCSVFFVVDKLRNISMQK